MLQKGGTLGSEVHLIVRAGAAIRVRGTASGVGGTYSSVRGDSKQCERDSK